MAVAMKDRTHCPQGHPYDEANTCVSNGRRHCRVCGQERSAQRRKAGVKTIVRCPSCGEERVLAGDRERERLCRPCAHLGHAVSDGVREAVAASNRKRKGRPWQPAEQYRAEFAERGRLLGLSQRGAKRSPETRAKLSENMRKRHAEGKIPYRTPAKLRAIRDRLLPAQRFRDTAPELAVVALLDALGATYEREVYVSQYRVDFLLADGTVVEVFGCWWHGCPCKNPDGAELRERDRKRLDALRTSREVIVLWEHDLRDLGLLEYRRVPKPSAQMSLAAA